MLKYFSKKGNGYEKKKRPTRWITNRLKICGRTAFIKSVYKLPF